MNEAASENKNYIIKKKNEFLKEKLLPVERSYFYSQYNMILKQIADKISEYSIEMNEDEDDFENRLYDAFEIVRLMKTAVKIENEQELEEETKNIDLQGETTKKEDHEIWVHGNIQQAFYQGFESEHSKKIDREWLTEIAIKYLHRPWVENELLEWILVDSLMFGELVGVGESIKQYSPKGLFNLNENYYAAKGNIKEMEKINVKEYFIKLGYKIVGFC